MVVLRVGNGTFTTRQSVSTVNFSVWNFIAVSVNRAANTVTFHVNGVNEPPQSLAVAGSFDSTADLLIGATYDLTAAFGEIGVDELEIFNRPLATAEMSSLWNAGSAGKCKAPCTNSVVSITCPQNILQPCGPGVSVPYLAPQASSSCGTITSIICSPPSGTPFPLGTTTVICTATDSLGAFASCTFTVTVTPDTTKPVCPPALVNVIGCPPRVPDFANNGMVTDNCTPVGQINVQQSLPPGTELPPGQIPMTLTACDAAGNCIICNFTLVATYTRPPPFTGCPDDEPGDLDGDGEWDPPGNWDPTKPVIIEEVDEDAGYVDVLYPQFDTLVDTWYENFPSEASIGGMIPAGASNPDFVPGLAAQGVTGISPAALAAQLDAWQAQINAIDAAQPNALATAPTATGPYTPPAIPHCKPEGKYVFGGRDIVFVHGLQLQHIVHKILGKPGAGVPWIPPAQLPGSIQNPQYYGTGYYKVEAEKVWDSTR